jgi:hypothetical protein
MSSKNRKITFCTDRQGNGSNSITGFVVKWSCGGGSQQESWSPQPRIDWEEIEGWMEKSQEGHWIG